MAIRDSLLASAADANGLASVIDTTTSQGAMTIVGPLAREIFARFTAIDLRPQVTPVHGFRPGTVARTGGAILCEAPDRYLMLFGAALGQYVWTVVADAAEQSRRRPGRRGRAGAARCLTSSGPGGCGGSARS